jgi:hypothetical protein
MELANDFLPGINAALGGAGKYMNKAFFFKGGTYVRYDWSTGQVEGYPLNLNAWNLPLTFLPGIDAAVNGYGPFAGKAYSRIRRSSGTARFAEAGVKPSG